MPLLSVIIPTHKRPSLLERAIISALNMSLNSDVEVIVVPNGTDDTWRTVAQKLKNDLRVRWLPISVGNACAARNHGLANAQGKYVRFLDDDDYLLPASTKQLIFAKKHNLDISSAPLSIVTPSGVSFFKYQLPDSEDFATTTLLSIAISGFTQGSLFKRSCIQGAKWREDVILYDDYFWMLDLVISQEFTWRYTEQPVAAYVQHDGTRLSRLRRSSLNSRPLVIAILQMHSHLKSTERLTPERNMATASALLTHAHSAFPNSPFFLRSVIQKALEIEATAVPQQPIFRKYPLLASHLLATEWIILLPRYLSRSYRRTSWFIANLAERFSIWIKARSGTID